MIKYTTAIVTYADRGRLIKKVIQECISAGCDQFFIVDNGSSEASKRDVHDIINKFGNVDFSIIVNKYNMGSAFAFSQAMDLACTERNKNEYILFLDDDNVAMPDSIQHALTLAMHDKYINDTFFLFRKDRSQYVSYVNYRDEAILLGRKNSFMNFSFSGYFERKTKKIYRKEIALNNVDSNIIPVPCGPYGGMLTTKKILSAGIRPKKNMFVYFDDTDYSLRLAKSGVRLWLLTDSELIDIDDSWTNEKLKSNYSSPLFEAQEFKVRYTVRNRMYFERMHLVDNKIKYVTNLSLFMFLLFLKAVLSMNIKRYFILWRYIYQGFKFQ